MYQCCPPGGRTRGPRGRMPRRLWAGSRTSRSDSRSYGSAPRPCVRTSAPRGVLSGSRRTDVTGLRSTRSETYIGLALPLVVALGLALGLVLGVALGLPLVLLVLFLAFVPLGLAWLVPVAPSRLIGSRAERSLADISRSVAETGGAAGENSYTPGRQASRDRRLRRRGPGLAQRGSLAGRGRDHGPDLARSWRRRGPRAGFLRGREEYERSSPDERERGRNGEQADHGDDYPGQATSHLFDSPSPSAPGCR